MKTQTFDVIGMTCAACQANVTKAVSRIEGVAKADVSLLSNSMKVEYDPEKTDEKAICRAVENIGYEAVLPNALLQEAGLDSVQEKWNARQEALGREMKEKRQSLILSLILLAFLMCFSMLPMLGIFSFLMDMEWMMVSAVMQLFLCMLILFFQRSFFFHGFKALIKRAPNMDSLVAVGSGVSFAYGMYGILKMAYGYGIMDHSLIHSSMDALYFESAAMILTLVSLGKYLEARSKAKTGDALGKLVDLSPKTAVIEKDGVQIQVAASQVVSGDVVIIRPGQRIPVDGIVLSGTGFVDQAALTGESVPVEKQPGDEVLSASININGTFKFTATKVGSDTTLAQIIRLVSEAGDSKAPIARLADSVSGIFVPVVLVLAAVTAAFWLFLGKDIGFALNAAVCVLVISCPCALGLATPLAIMVASGKAAEYGILIKSAASLEMLHSINTVVLDKTGTITSGKPAVTDIAVLDPSYTPDGLLCLAAALESGSEHPLGKAVVAKAQKENLRWKEPEKFEAVGGKGLKAVVDGELCLAGNALFMEEEGLTLSPQEKEMAERYALQGKTPLFFARKKRLAGLICVADTVRPDSFAALKALKAMHIETVMLTGDNQNTARAIAKGLDLDRVISDVLPSDKEAVIRSLQQEGKKVAMVGDGINDAPALARADVGIAIGAGSDIAIESADVVLMKDSLMDVVTAVDLSRKTIKNIRENLFWAFFYNCLGIPVAMGALYPFFGILLNPMYGAAAMSLSSVTVCLNALRLRLFHPQNETQGQIEEQKVSAAQVKQEMQKMEDFPQAVEQQALQEQEYSVLLHIEGMSCAHCQKAVRQALEQVPHVVRAEVFLENQEAFVEGSQKLNIPKLLEAVKEAGYTASVKEEKEKTMEKELIVEGMSCAHCQKHVEKALMGVEGVQSAKVDLKSKTAFVTCTAAAADEQLAKAVEEAGYDVASVKSI